MTIIFFILLIAVILIILIFTISIRVKVVFDTCETGLNMTLSWLHSFLKALVTIENTRPMLTLYLFNKRLFNKYFNKGKGKLSSAELAKLVDSSDIHVNAYYGFRDPFSTGITCGAINAASQFINIDSINQMPDFTAENDYIYLDADAKVNLGSSLIRLFRFKVIS
jgi:hypothetical protein